MKLKNRKYHHYKNQFFLDDVDIDNILISDLVSSGEKNYKFFISYMGW